MSCSSLLFSLAIKLKSYTYILCVCIYACIYTDKTRGNKLIKEHEQEEMAWELYGSDHVTEHVGEICRRRNCTVAKIWGASDCTTVLCLYLFEQCFSQISQSVELALCLHCSTQLGYLDLNYKLYSHIILMDKPVSRGIKFENLRVMDEKISLWFLCGSYLCYQLWAQYIVSKFGSGIWQVQTRSELLI